jgi:adenylate cyclase class 2
MLDRIQAAGFTVCRERVFEANRVYDTPAGTIRASGQLLRVREAGDAITLTWKGPAGRTGDHKSRAEIETSIGDPRAFDSILRHLGFAPVFRYEKFRTEFAKPGEPGVITLDETPTPIGWFLELEGEPAWIDSTASILGFSKTDYVTASYTTLYLAHCRSSGQLPGWMVFPDSR